MFTTDCQLAMLRGFSVAAPMPKSSTGNGMTHQGSATQRTASSMISRACCGRSAWHNGKCLQLKSRWPLSSTKVFSTLSAMRAMTFARCKPLEQCTPWRGFFQTASITSSTAFGKPSCWKMALCTFSDVPSSPCLTYVLGSRGMSRRTSCTSKPCCSASCKKVVPCLVFTPKETKTTGPKPCTISAEGLVGSLTAAGADIRLGAIDGRADMAIEPKKARGDVANTKGGT